MLENPRDERVVNCLSSKIQPSAEAQRIFESLLTLAPTNLWAKLRTRRLRQARKRLVRKKDPLVEFCLDGTRLLMPLSHELPFYRQAMPQYSTNVARIARRVLEKYPGLTFIDIGANVGDTVAILRRRAHFPVLCIEGSSLYFTLLQKNAEQLGPDLVLENAFITHTRHIRGHLDLSAGSGRLMAGDNSVNSLNLRTLRDVIEQHSRFREAKMIKVDTDGLDCAILGSEIDLLANLRPVLFFEYDPYLFKQFGDDGFALFERLARIGYGAALVYENSGDYLLTARLGEKTLLEDLHQFYSGRGAERYCDICAFHCQDLDLCWSLRSEEMKFFAGLRGFDLHSITPA